MDLIEKCYSRMMNYIDFLGNTKSTLFILLSAHLPNRLNRCVTPLSMKIRIYF